MSTQGALPDCPDATCQQLAAHIGQLCKERSWPPDQPVIVESSPGHWCYCYCRDCEGTDALGAPVHPCDWATCQFDPKVVKGCQDVPSGTPILFRPKNCRCLCWDGVLAPYKVKNGDGQYVALDRLAAGTFVTAAGLDLYWYKVMVRYAARPRQAFPQRGIRITTGGSQLVVPTIHMFLTYQQKLILADQMEPRIALMGIDGTPVGVTTIEEIETELVYQFVATAQDVPQKDLQYHLLDAEGVVVGDYAIEDAYQKHQLPPSLLAFPYDYQSPVARPTPNEPNTIGGSNARHSSRNDSTLFR